MKISAWSNEVDHKAEKTNEVKKSGTREKTRENTRAEPSSEESLGSLPGSSLGRLKKKTKIKLLTR